MIGNVKIDLTKSVNNVDIMRLLIGIVKIYLIMIKFVNVDLIRRFITGTVKLI